MPFLFFYSYKMAREKKFRFKHFSVLNDKTAMKVGTDGVLLGAWCDVKKVESALDVGTGCGVIALMIAQRNAECIVDCIDIDDSAIAEASINVKNSPWSDRVFSSLADFKHFKPLKKYDLIVSNPPFFNNGILAPDKNRMNARHNVELNLEQMFKCAIPLLKDEGKLCLITPADSENEIIELCHVTHTNISKKTLVITKPGKKAKRCLWEITKRHQPCLQEEIYIQLEDGSFSKEYIKLCGNFYLNM